ncbi:MAG TPA: protein-glutamate O-methyltransferase CheR, partial [Candidatus Eubacterium avistercoris]|nr:protein-glutamate O-methyltransferase CheR [Candidatus Eubacterium avistercoris]
RMIIFAPHSMLSDPPFGKLDLISCRNVMIYFQPVLQRMLFSIFHSALKKNGYLFLGKSENAGEFHSQ